MSGYGIGDNLRDKTERIFALLYGAQAALVRPQIISGTHALAIALFGVLRPGDLLACVTGAPYDTMEEIIGIRPSDGSLAEFGVRYVQCDLTVSPSELLGEADQEFPFDTGTETCPDPAESRIQARQGRFARARSHA